MAKMMKMQVSGKSEGMKTYVKAGKHEIVVDEAEQMGGDNAGANPLQYLLTALTGCTNAVAHMAAKEIDFDLQELSIKASGEFDPRGFMGDPEVRSHFQTATLTVEVKTSESEESLNELKEMVSSRCPVYSTFIAADIEMNDTWTIV